MIKRARKSKRGNSSHVARLLEVLTDVSKLVKKSTTGKEAYCQIENNKLCAKSGPISIYADIEEDFTSYPHIHTLLAAITECTEEVSLVQQSENALRIESGKFSAMIKCIGADVPEIQPPNLTHQLPTNTLLDLIQEISKFGRHSDTVLQKSVLLTPNSMVYTNEKLSIVEFWHGMGFPGSFQIPMLAIKLLARLDKPIVGIGGDETSITFKLDNGTYIKTALYENSFPEYQGVFYNFKIERLEDIPDNLFQVVKVINEFCENQDAIFFESNRILSGSDLNFSTNYEIGESFDKMKLWAPLLLDFKHCAKQFAYYEPTYILYLTGEKMRGAIKCIDPNENDVLVVSDINEV